MGWFRKSEKSIPTPPAKSAGAEHRRAPRFSSAVISCMLGQVCDLSSCGMRITCTKAPPVNVGDMVRLELQSPKDELLVVGRVARLQRRGPAGFEIGIEFQQLTPELGAALDSLARHGCIKGVKPSAGAQQAGAAGKIGVTAAAQLPDLYSLLGVAPGADATEVHRAFRELARQYHPDLNPSADAQAKFIELHKAYDVLKSPEKRQAYHAAWINSGNTGGARRAA
jgi:DnaJ-domain-containing protein 1